MFSMLLVVSMLGQTAPVNKDEFSWSYHGSMNPLHDSPFVSPAFDMNDPAIRWELDKVDHTQHWLEVGFGSALLATGIVLAVKNKSPVLGTVFTGISLPITALGWLGLFNLSE